jgi:hypothetical protein
VGKPSDEPFEDVMALPSPGRRRRRLRQRQRVVDRLAAELAGDGPPSTPGASLQRGVSVVVPSFEGAAHLGACLESLGRQTLDPSLFEVVVVLNGPSDGSRAVVDAFTRVHPQVDVQLVELADRAGIGVARNAGISQARRQSMALLDDDDTVSPQYLDVLLRHARWDVVPLAGLVDVAPDGTLDEATPFNRVLHQHAGKVVEARSAPSLLSLNACKLLPTELVQRVGCDTELRSGVDVEFLVSLYAEGRFLLHALSRSEGATYYRSLRRGSVSRRGYDFAFSIEGRLDVIERIARHAVSTHPGTAVVAQTLAGAQAGFMRRYLDKAPDEREAVLAAIRRRDLPWFPYSALNRDSARRLVVSYCFTPYAGPSAIVSAKRVQQRAEVVDVLQNAMDDVRAVDPGTDALAEEYVDRKILLTTKTLFGAWSAIRDFCEESRASVARLIECKGEPYTSMHSRAMWPASHFAAALLKLDDPSVHWSAEFSDPVSHDVHGELRRGKVKADTVSRKLLAAMPASFGGYDLSVFEWCEQIAYHLADELVFTNPNQLQVMLETCPPALRDTVRAKAVIEPQPAPLPRFYSLAEVEQVADPDRTSIAYFGAFYATRGLGEVFTALAQLPPEERDALRLDVFTGSTSVVLDAIREQPWADVVRVHEYRPYLEFLALTTQYDALLVNDAETSSVHSVNPYLPSKYSDYRGSGTPIWGHVEPGSMLSKEPLELVSTVGDVASVRRVLADLAARVSPSRRAASPARR